MSQSPYQAAHDIPLIKSPSLRVPHAIELPQDIHPLPDSVNPYFVYPFTLESLVINVEDARRSTLAAHATRRDAYLRAREDERERRKRDALRRIAPGFDPRSTPLVPTRGPSSTAVSPPGFMGSLSPDHPPVRSVMDDLVNQLAALDSASSTPGPGSHSQ
ncbi:hypothetical protein HYPSUDRAFT_207516 [Hypholoma sublateritium FD-334 SS-4]|uniref:Uncharacterized protein n=1 Tax=Hypholoma sublateritium (strain FD-334 SS-4) TaxID=945553 RepID=A0A0D2NGN7_HYPSF|nr:hypothetical protein HYPSUDRAFT_207516 [Hypholoma sublateritium FD-334 SS-4]